MFATCVAGEVRRSPRLAPLAPIDRRSGPPPSSPSTSHLAARLRIRGARGVNVYASIGTGGGGAGDGGYRRPGASSCRTASGLGTGPAAASGRTRRRRLFELVRAAGTRRRHRRRRAADGPDPFSQELDPVSLYRQGSRPDLCRDRRGARHRARVPRSGIAAGEPACASRDACHERAGRVRGERTGVAVGACDVFDAGYGGPHDDDRTRRNPGVAARSPADLGQLPASGVRMRSPMRPRRRWRASRRSGRRSTIRSTSTRPSASARRTFCRRSRTRSLAGGASCHLSDGRPLHVRLRRRAEGADGAGVQGDGCAASTCWSSTTCSSCRASRSSRSSATRSTR